MDLAATSAEAPKSKRRWRLRLPERLPNLKGKWLTLYTIVWAVVLPLSLVGSARGTFISLTTPTMWSPYGFATNEYPDGLRVELVSSRAARDGGLKAGDYVVGVDGWTVPTVAGRAAAREHVVKPDGSFTTFTIRRPDGQVFDIQLVRSIRNEEEAFREAGVSRPLFRAARATGTLVTPLLILAAAILLFVRRRNEAVPALLSLSFLLLVPMINGPDMIGVSLTIMTAFGVGSVALLFAALLAFPSGRFEPRWTAIPFLLVSVWLFFPLFGDLPGVPNLLGAAFFLAALVVLVTRYRRLGAGAERQQLRWAFFGLAVGVTGQLIGLAGGLTQIAWQAEDPRWSAWGDVIIVFGNLLFCAMFVGLLVSILRYRLYDADTVIGRSAAYGLLTLGFVALFAGSQKVIELLGEEYLGQSMGAVAGGIGAALAAVAIAPMHNRAQRWAERRFQKSLYRLRHALPALVGDLRETSGLEQIAGATLDSIVEGVRARRAALVARGKLIDAREVPAKDVKRWWRGWPPAQHDGIDWEPSDPLFPARVPLEAEGHGRVGWLLLGPRPDGSLFGKAECDALEQIAEPVARAIEVALAREDRERCLEERLQQIERRLDNIPQSTTGLAGAPPDALPN